jgi:CubicO group peptidase (beta-lactamase class C family)
MRRLLVIISLVGLVLASLAVATLAADWPFWQRAWRWHQAGISGPEHIPGSWQAIGAGGGVALLPLRDDAVEAALAVLAQTRNSQALLASRGGRLVAEYYGAGYDADSLWQGRGLTTLVLAPLYGVARRDGIELLDQPVAALLPEWRDDPRGEITPRQLFWQLSGLVAPQFQPLNPFSDRARLAAGPNFERAALGTALAYPPGSHYADTPANAQLLGAVLSRARHARLVDLLDQGLWRPLGAGQAKLMLDRQGGDMAAHCCLQARARDWLRVAGLLASDGRANGQQLMAPGFVQDMARAAPVNPGQGLGVELMGTARGDAVLLLRSPGRLLLVVPAREIAVVWFVGGDAGADAVPALLAAVSATSPEHDPERPPPE